ncbi:histidine phosphotransferase family protein [Rhodopila sp.]|uniref:histidine phosphotransferase family protein n=1 Tax=Rhodopila sp. TaxID=2480087 RepID=UPI003D0AFAEB
MSGTHGALRLIELTSAHLCRDLGGLVGLLDGGRAVTVGGAMPGDPAAAVPIQPDRDTAAPAAAKALTTRLELRRAAWGPQAGPDGEPLSLAQLKRLVGGLPGRVGVGLSALHPDTVFPADSGRIVLNLLLLAADSLPFGGAIMLAGSADDLFIRIAGTSAAWPTGIAVCLADEAEARSALTEQRSLQMALTALLAHAARIRLSLVMSPTANDGPAILRLGG